MKSIPCKMPDEMIVNMDNLISSKRYVSRSDVIRTGLRNLFAIEKISKQLNDELIEEEVIPEITLQIIEEEIEQQKMKG